MSYSNNSRWDDIDATIRKHYGGLDNLQKRDYQKLAAAVCDIGKQIEQMFLSSPMGRPDAAQIAEMVAARIGLALALENKKFDSFRWAAACKGEKENE